MCLCLAMICQNLVWSPGRWCAANGCSGSKKSWTLLVVHAHARFTDLHVGPQCTTTPSSEISKAADTCSTLWDMRKSYTEL